MWLASMIPDDSSSCVMTSGLLRMLGAKNFGL
jgi:hypothetical protein